MGTDPSSARQAILSMKGAVAQRGDRAPSWSAEEMKDRASPSCGAVLAPLREAWRTAVHYAQPNEKVKWDLDSMPCLYRTKQSVGLITFQSMWAAQPSNFVSVHRARVLP